MVGTDICNISRFSKMNNLDKFLKKYFTDSEREYVILKGNRFETIAGIFSAKEAFVKALGLGFGSIKPIDVEVKHDFSGNPYIVFNSVSLSNKVENVSCSISHDGDYAISVVSISLKDNLCIDDEYKYILKERDIFGNKGTFGKVGIIGGSAGMCGSVDLCAKSSLRSGCGLVYNVCPKSISDILQIKAVENIVLPINDNHVGHFILDSLPDILNYLSKFDAVAIGCGMGEYFENIEVLDFILQNFKKPVVIDADGIKAFKNIQHKFSDRKNIILTPHCAEFSFLSNQDLEYINKNRLESVIDYVDNIKSKSTVVLKGKGSIIFSNGNYCVNKTGNDGMATAGSGDCLTGIIVSLLAQGLKPFESAKLGVYLHGLAGDLAADEIGKDSLIASDIIEFLPKAFNLIRR
ncbi:MAG: NAD(P)H-hydrate dehydratase [Peptoniphilaceae bacterium]|uniref:NAD(P)H-hydrate dehydratase n=1 Tax=Parvimonas sp. TaxID=1944660 RepID=UPI0025E755C3|nr:NAD(P)H-hydrate dehydratase [Parvimonas sp.]MCI5996699.1 NAD(P)H-hydrate dehydratase [Parvimonas sp.]MDD7764918.1 NAD(P)H-hydrate dehydratase [Peptoniphilaceae bacterium]MDY3050646.1 NAD(P)H-hydrate dehydratase [Parvimonas sp.]